jgi:hypothetical protein
LLDSRLGADLPDGGESVSPADQGMVAPPAGDTLADDPTATGPKRSGDPVPSFEDLGGVGRSWH